MAKRSKAKQSNIKVLYLALILIGIVTVSFWILSQSSFDVPSVGQAPGKAKRVTTSVAVGGISLNELAPKFGDKVSFTVSPPSTRNIYDLWVANKCYQNGLLVSVQYLSVQWPSTTQGVAGPFGLGANTGSTISSFGWSNGGAQCTAYVWEFPSSETPVQSTTYTVSP